MSKYVDQLMTGEYVESIANLDECKHLYNGVCCNDQSDMVADFPGTEYCKTRCRLFEKEDGILR